MLLLCAALLVHARFIYGFYNSSNFSTEQSIKYTHITASSYKNNENASSSNSNKNVTGIRGITYGTTTTKLGNIVYGSTGDDENRIRNTGPTTETQNTTNSFMTSRDRDKHTGQTPLELSTLATVYKKWQINNSTLVKQISNRLFDNTNKLLTTPTTIIKVDFTEPLTADKIIITSNSSKSYSKEYNHFLTTRKQRYSRRTNTYRNFFTNVTKSSFHNVPSSQQTGTSNNTTPMNEESFNTRKENFSTTDSTTDSLSYSYSSENTTLLNSYKSLSINSTSTHETFPYNLTEKLAELYYEPINMTTLHTNTESKSYRELKQITSTHYNEPSKKTTNYISKDSVPINQSKFSVSEGIKNTKGTDAYMFTGPSKDNGNNETSYTQYNFSLESIGTPSKNPFISSQNLTRNFFTTTEKEQYLQSSLINIKKNWTSTTNDLGPGIQNKSDISFLSTVDEENTPIRYYNLTTTVKSTSVSDSKSTKYIPLSVPENGNKTKQTNVRPLNASTVVNLEIFNSTTMTTQITSSNYNVTRPAKKCDIKCQKNEMCVFTKRNKKQCICKPNFEREKNSKICKEVRYSDITTPSYYSTTGRTISDHVKVTDEFQNQEEQNYWVYSFKKWNNLTKHEKIYNAVTITFNEEVEALEWFRNYDLHFRRLIAALLRKGNYTCKDSANNYTFDARNVVYIAPSPLIKNGTSTVTFIVESVDKNCTQKYVSGQTIKDMLFKLDNGTVKQFQLYIISVDIGKPPEVILCEVNSENVLKLVITSVTITAIIASFLVLAILLIKCRQCNKLSQPRVHQYKTWDSKCAFTTGNDLASDIQCVGDETDIVMECNGIKTGKVKELSKPYEKLSVLVHNEEKLELECSTSVKMKFKDKDDSKL